VQSGRGVEQAQKSGTPSSFTARQAQAPLVKRASVVTVTASNNVGKSEGERKHEASLCL
jgi:hypothetical protein